MTMRVVFLRRTRADLVCFQRYYEYIFPEGARQASGQYLASRKTLRENPLIGREIDESEYREFPIARTPFVFVYRIRDNEIQVLRIWDARRNPNDNLV